MISEFNEKRNNRLNFFKSLSSFNYSSVNFPLRDLVSYTNHLDPLRKSDIRCALSELVVHEALLKNDFVFFSKDDFSTNYDIVETNYNLKFFKGSSPVFEFDFFGSHNDNIYAIEVKSKAPSKNFDSLRLLHCAQSLTNSSTGLLVFAPFSSDSDFKEYISSKKSSKIHVINTKLSSTFYDREIARFYSATNKSSFIDEISDILKKI